MTVHRHNRDAFDREFEQAWKKGKRVALVGVAVYALFAVTILAALVIGVIWLAGVVF